MRTVPGFKGVRRPCPGYPKQHPKVLYSLRERLTFVGGGGSFLRALLQRAPDNSAWRVGRISNDEGNRARPVPPGHEGTLNATFQSG